MIITMNNEQKYALFTGILALGALIAGGLVLTKYEGLKTIILIGLLVLAALGCLVQGRLKITPKPPASSDPNENANP